MSNQLCPVQSLIDGKIDADNFELFTSKLKGQVILSTCPFVVSIWQQENQIYKITNYQPAITKLIQKP